MAKDARFGDIERAHEPWMVRIYQWQSPSILKTTGSSQVCKLV